MMISHVFAEIYCHFSLLNMRAQSAGSWVVVCVSLWETAPYLPCGHSSVPPTGHVVLHTVAFSAGHASGRLGLSVSDWTVRCLM